jgi:hypothetical protein
LALVVELRRAERVEEDAGGRAGGLLPANSDNAQIGGE